MTTELISTPNGYIEVPRKLPGTIPISGKEFLYFQDNGEKDIGKQILALAAKIKPHIPKGGGIISQASRIRLSDGMLFHGISYRGDIEGWRRQMEEGAKALDLLLAKIHGESIVISDGRSVALADCEIEID